MIQTTIPCRRCDEPMIEIKFSRHYMRVCNKLGCPLYRQSQGSRERDMGFLPITGFYSAPLSPPPSNPLPFKKKIKKKIKIKNKIKRNV